ncbi:Endonuclease/exonuclease/phosphatase [Annulohypoxylon truncatum]|uniref:Endonuclease/exonuclease/phosphatase n=1 Tax=Annulohypoxylon truncatum TaxID=327061 RepID=UPI002007BB36|nr:Endonuclease/exonuclease/phosphatase [Annulohypoxylon truncatum]KAI1212715.1 Endonuclease/exonuclease/phosphatase [Annulohypoxylon truncatum]
MANVDCFPEEVNVLTLNCWGIPYVSQARIYRLEEIGRHIVKADPQPHIVGLQECFSRKDFERIQQETRSILPYSKQYFAGPLGTGLVLLSRWPIEETSMTRYPLNGSPTALFHGDWYAGKGVAYARIRYGKEPDNVIDIFNTHLHAYYPGNEYVCHRVSQAWELAKLLQDASRRRHGRALVILLGDLNADPTSLPYHILKSFAPVMRDTWLQYSVQHKQSPSGDQGFSSNTRGKDVDIQSGVTYGSPCNTWMWTRAQRARYLKRPVTSTSEFIVPAEVGREQAVRIDYVLASVSPLQFTAMSRDHKDIEIDPSTDGFGGRSDAGKIRSVKEGSGVWTVKLAKVGMVDRHPVLGCSLSDHFSVETTLAFRQVEQGGPERQDLLDEPSGSVLITSIEPEEAMGSKTRVQTLQGVAADVTSTPGGTFGELDDVGLLDEILHVLNDFDKIRRWQARWRRVRLGVASTVLAGSLVGVWVVNAPGWARFLLALAGALASAFVALDIWARLSLTSAETAALGELEWEVRNVKRSQGVRG